MPRTIVWGVVLITIALSGCQGSSPGAFEAPTHAAVVSAPADIREGQRLLNTLGYDAGAADGVVGPRTRSAITDYQTRNGLKQTGQLTSHLLHQLRRKAQGLQAARSAQTTKTSQPPQPKAVISTAQTVLPSVAAADADLGPCGRNETSGELGHIPRLSDPS